MSRSGRYEFGLVACARWEAPYIVEWLNYYRLLGYDHVFLYCNDDDPAALYELVLPFLLGPRPFVTFRHHPAQGEQCEMYSHFMRYHLDECGWISFIDIDEFIRLPPGETIGTFLAGFGDRVDCMLFNWIFFGPNGHKTPPSGNVLRNFIWRERDIHPLTKYVVRGSALERNRLASEEGTAFWHTPQTGLIEGAKVLNVLGEDMRDYYAGFPVRSQLFVNDPLRKDRILSTAIIHHYAHRSERAFHERVDRGLGGTFGGQTVWRELADSEGFQAYLGHRNAVLDESLAGLWPGIFAQSYRLSTSAPGNAVTLADSQAFAVNLARGRPATQSSVSQWSNGTAEQDAAGALSGHPNGRRNFHTERQAAPWWQVDLGALRTIAEIRIYNTLEPGLRERFARFSIAIAFDQDDWIEVFRKEDDEIVGGLDGHPFIWKPDLSAFAQFIRVTLSGTDFLHLDQVEVFGPGEPLPVAVPRPAASQPEAGTPPAPAPRSAEAAVPQDPPPARKGLDQRLDPAPGHAANLARGRPAMQSSASEWSNGTAEQDAAGAVNGQANGQRNFHTKFEFAPWWQVDLGVPRTIAEVRIYNTLEEMARGRFARFSIAVASDPDGWIEVFRKDDDDEIGGIDGHPFIWRPDLSAFARFVRITLLGMGFLHLDQVEVYGPGAPPPVQVVQPDAELFARFISLGDNCEFGIVQHQARADGFDLLRAGGTRLGKFGLILALRERFAALGTVEDGGVFENDSGQWMSFSRRYDLEFHTARFVAKVPREKQLEDDRLRLRFLANKLIEDLERGDKIFIHKSKRPVAAEEMHALHEAMQAYGAPMLLWVSPADDDHENATVERLAPRFLRGYIRHLASYDDAVNVHTGDWRALCHAVLDIAGP